MNADRRFPFAEKVYGVIVSIQLWFESFFPKPYAIIFDISELDEISQQAWIEEFKRSINGSSKS